MSSSSDPTDLPSLKKGDYHPATSDALRSPCPVINAWANHGYLPRDGRNVTAEHFRSGFQAIGIGSVLTNTLIHGAYIEHKHNDQNSPDHHPNTATPNPNTDLCAHGGGLLSGLRHPGQVNSSGTPILNLDQIGRHGAIEHDVSISRRDFAQGDNTTPQPDLIANFLASPADGKVFTTSDFGKLRHERYKQQKKDNPQLNFGPAEEQTACGELAFIQGVFGRGLFWQIPIEYLKALFEEERFPVREGWTKRWIPLSPLEFGGLLMNLKRYCGVEFSKDNDS